jgi:membrane protease YdiL (CAAX protease family)
MLIAAFCLAFLMLLVGIAGQFLRRSVPHNAPPPLPQWGQVRTWWCGPFDALGLLLISGVFILFGLAAAASEGKNPEQSLTPSLLIGNILTFAVLVGAVTAIVYRRVRPSTWLGLQWSQWPHFFWIGPSAVLAMWVVLGVLNASGYIAWMERLVGSSSTQDAVALMRDSKDVWSVGLMAFSAAIVAPLAEEVIFRGYLYPVAKSFGGITAGVLFSALLFAACHGNVPLMLPLFMLGILLALVYEWTGSIWASISIHFFFNSATVAMQLALRAGWFPELPTS